VWALGCILLEMLLGTALWDLDFDLGIKAIEDPHYIYEFINKELPQKYSSHLKSIVKKMLNPDPQDRLTIEELMKKKFIKQWQNKLRHYIIKRKSRSEIKGVNLDNLNKDFSSSN
jgi:serine/threonine protein kinase